MKKMLGWIFGLFLIISMISCTDAVAAGETTASGESRSGGGYFYDLLENQEQKDLYDAVLASAYSADGIITGTAEAGAEYSLPSGMSESTWMTGKNFPAFSFALTRDHPELFWVDYNDISSFGYKSGNGKINIYISPIESNYYWNGFTDEAQVRQIKEELDAKAAEVISSCQTADRYQTLVRLNRWIAENNTYNTVAAANKQYEMAWSAASGLLSGNEASKGPVCHGYATTLKLLCDRVGIPCIIVEGKGYVSASKWEGHAWNYVQMEDGKWYAIDCTWNDTGREAGLESYFLVGKDTVTASDAAIKTFGQNHINKENVRYPQLAADRYAGEKMVAQVGNTCYSDLQQAIDAADKSHPIVLLDHVETSRTISISNEITLFTAGKSIRNGGDVSLSPVIKIENGASLTLHNAKENTTYEGDVRQMGTGTAIENNGKLIVRNGMIDRAGKSALPLIAGNAYELGKNSLKIAEMDTFLNVGEAAKPSLLADKYTVNVEELPEQTVDDLTEYINKKQHISAHKWVTGKDILQSNLIQTPLFTTDDTGLLKAGRTYSYTAWAYGYPLQISVAYLYKGFSIQIFLDDSTWKDSRSNGLEFKSGEQVCLAEPGEDSILLKPGNWDVRLHGNKIGAVCESGSLKFYTVTFYDGSSLMSDPAQQTVLRGDHPAMPSNPAKPEYDFAGWQDAQGQNYDFNAGITEKTAINAVFTKKPPAGGDDNPPDTNPPDTTSPDTNPPDTNPPDTNPPDTNPPDTNPPDTTPPDTNPPSTTPPDINPPSTTPPNTNPPVTASPDTGSQQTYLITFQVNGGKKLSMNQKTVTYQEVYGQLPRPKRSGYEFLGWYTRKSGGTQIKENSKVTILENTTFYARWRKIKVGQTAILKTKNVKGKRSA